MELITGQSFLQVELISLIGWSGRVCVKVVNALASPQSLSSLAGGAVGGRVTIAVKSIAARIAIELVNTGNIARIGKGHLGAAAEAEIPADHVIIRPAPNHVVTAAACYIVITCAAVHVIAVRPAVDVIIVSTTENIIDARAAAERVFAIKCPLQRKS